MKIVVFESQNRDKFYPLSQTKAIWELRCGIFSFKERLENLLIGNDKLSFKDIYYFTDDLISENIKELDFSININDFSIFDVEDEILFVNSSLFLEENFLIIPSEILFQVNNENVICRANWKVKNNVETNITKIIESFDFKTEIINYNFAEYIWDLVALNSEILLKDFKMAKNIYGVCNQRGDLSVVGDGNNLFIEKNVRIDPCVVFDTSSGPIYISEGAEIHSFTRIEGPAFIGKNSIILGAKIRMGSSIGEMCRIGGEIEESIFHSYSNKYHDGFIGHSYIGEWVNMGAGTTNSDLKNSYSNVMVQMPFERIDSNSYKIGSFIGDFSKTSIGSLLNTGSVIGTGAMLVFNGKITPPFIANFKWFINSKVESKDWFDDFIISTEKMMMRRKKRLNLKLKNLLSKLYEQNR